MSAQRAEGAASSARLARALAVAVALLVCAPTPASGLSPQPNPDTWVTDAQVQAIATGDGRTFLGGAFSYVGPRTGPGVLLSATSGGVIDGFPMLGGGGPGAGDAVSDGSGGFYVAGTFSLAGGTPRSGLMHLLADGTLDPDFAPVVTGAASALARAGTTLYVGGRFTALGGAPRQGLGAIDLTTGQVTAWNPPSCHNDNANAEVYDVEVEGGTIYVAGSVWCYTAAIGWRHTLFALDAATGALRDFYPNANGQIYDVEASPTAVYAAGSFTRIGGSDRYGIGQVEPTWGAATSWNPAPNSQPSTLELVGDDLYVGGSFTTIGGAPRHAAARLSAATAQADEWDPDVGGASQYSGGSLYDLDVSGTTAYLAGRFARVAGEPRRMLAAVNTTTGEPSGWAPPASDTVTLVAASGAHVYIGGWFASVGGVLRNGLAAIDDASGEALAWNPQLAADIGPSNADGQAIVEDLTLDGGTLYVAGAFSSAAGLPRANLAAVSTSAGSVLAWNPGADGVVRALARDGGTLYAGGDFTQAGGAARSHVAAITTASGQATGWNPGADGIVHALALGTGVLYAGGEFQAAGGATRHRAAALSLATGTATDWNPDASGPVWDLEVTPDAIYAAGPFTSIGEDGPAYMAKLDPGDGVPMYWDAGFDGYVRDVAVTGSALFAAGGFRYAGGEERRYLAAIDTDDGSVLTWDPHADGDGSTVSVSAGALDVGGSFVTLGGQLVRGYARFALVRPPGAPVTPTSVSRGSFALTWPASLDAHHYVLEQRTADGGWEQVGDEVAAPAYAFVEDSATEGELRFRVTAVDAEDTYSVPSAPSAPVVVDRTAPDPPWIVTERDPDTSGGWFNHGVVVIFEADDAMAPDGSDGSGLDAASLPGDQQLTTTGIHTISGTARDLAGNVSASASLVVRLDVDRPRVSMTCPPNVVVGTSATASWTASDVGAGLTGPATGSVVLLPNASGPLSATAPTVRDAAGLTASPASCTSTAIASAVKPDTQRFSVGSAFRLPSNARCLKRGASMTLRFRRPTGVTIDRVEVVIGNRRLALLTGSRARKSLTLRKLPTRKFTLTVKVTPHGGKAASVRRTYAVCRS